MGDSNERSIERSTRAALKPRWRSRGERDARRSIVRDAVGGPAARDDARGKPTTGKWSGAVVPLIAILVPPAPLRIPATFFAVVVGLLATGWLSSHLGHAPKRAAIVRLVVGGALAMAITFGVGFVFGVATG